MNDETNPRAAIGGNFPPLARSIAAETGDFAQVVTAFLEEEYRQYPVQLTELLDEARALPKEIEDKATKDKAASVIKRMRDLNKKFDAFHEKEGQPYFRGKQAVDQFFFGMMDKLQKRAKNNNPGASDVLLSRITDYDNRILAAEQERRRLEAEETARIAREAQERAATEAREAEERRQAAERARAPAQVEVKTAAAQEAEQKASAAHVEATVTTARAEEAHIATLAKPADIMRSRGDDGTLSTMGQEKYATIVDRDKLDKAKLWPFIPLAALQQALTGFAKTTDYNTPMEGAEIGRKNKSKVL